MKEAKNNKTFLDPGKVIVASLALVGVALLILSQAVSQPGTIFLIASASLFAAFTLFPQLGFYLTVLALPVINWSFYVKGLIIPAVDLVAVITLFGFLFRALLDKLFSPSVRVKINLPYLKYFLIFFVATLISCFFSKYPLDSLWYALRWILFFYLGYLVVPYNLVTSERRLKITLVLFSISASLVTLMGLVSLFFQDWQNNFVRIQPTAFFNLYPVGLNHNLVAEFLVVGVFFLLALRYWKGSVLSRKLVVILSIIIALTALGTFSRAGWISLGICAVLYFFYQTVEFKRRYIVPALLSLVLIAPLAIYMVDLQSQFDIGGTSTENRVLLSEISLRAWRSSPFFGKGTGMFSNLVGEDIRFRAKYGDPLDSHGVWQKILAENGTLGVISFAGLCLVIFWSLRQGVIYLKGRKEFMLVLLLSLGALAAFIFQFFNTSYYKGKMWVPIAIALAAVNLFVKKKK